MSGQSMDDKTQEFEGNDFDSPSNKRMKAMSIDRLSALPDGILIQILSFLGGVEESAVRLIKKDLGVSLGRVAQANFYEFSEESEKRGDLVSKVNRTLLSRAGIRSEEFYVNFRFYHCWWSMVGSFEYPRRKSLTKVAFNKHEHSNSSIFALLKSSQNLERLAIYSEYDGVIWDEAAPGDSDCDDLLHLKAVKIFELRDPAIGSEQLVRTLLMRAKVLEEMKFTLGVEETNDFSKIRLTLLNYPRSSKRQ